MADTEAKSEGVKVNIRVDNILNDGYLYYAMINFVLPV